jgi:hypothetical protein
MILETNFLAEAPNIPTNGLVLGFNYNAMIGQTNVTFFMNTNISDDGSGLAQAAQDFANGFHALNINVSSSMLFHTIVLAFLGARYARKYIFKNPSKVATVLSHIAAELPSQPTPNASITNQPTKP